jgi:hypothetical protein
VIFAEKMCVMIFRWDNMDDGQPIFNAWARAPSNVPGPNADTLFRIHPKPFLDANRVHYWAQTPHTVLMAALADGSVRPLAGTMTEQTWWALSTPNGGEIVTNF